MPIGTSKVGLFGGKTPVVAGCETFNAPGTFTVPEGLEIVSVTGVGADGNPGNAGNPGANGAGGNGGAGGNVANPSNPCIYSGSPGGTGFAAGTPATAGNPGTGGCASTVFCLVFPGGVNGTGGAAGNDAGSGNPGNPAPSGPFPDGAESVGIAGERSCPTGYYGGNGSKGSRSVSPPCDTIFPGRVNQYGGAGGPGAGSNLSATCYGNPVRRSQCPISAVCGAGIGGQGAVWCSALACLNRCSNPGAAANGVRGGGGGGGGGTAPGGLQSFYASGGGGGGGGGVGNPGNPGNPGSAGNPSTSNCVPVTTGCYPVTVPTNGQVNISWNTQ